MRGVCSRAALNDRYFYEEFKTRDELLVAAWDNVRDEMLGEVSATFAERVGQPPIETIRAAISIVVLRIAQDAGRAQILLTQHVGSSTLQDRRAVALQEATQLVMAAISAWHAGLLVDVSQVDIVEHTSRLAETLARRYVVDKFG